MVPQLHSYNSQLYRRIFFVSVFGEITAIVCLIAKNLFSEKQIFVLKTEQQIHTLDSDRHIRELEIELETRELEIELQNLESESEEKNRASGVTQFSIQKDLTLKPKIKEKIHELEIERQNLESETERKISELKRQLP